MDLVPVQIWIPRPMSKSFFIILIGAVFIFGVGGVRLVLFLFRNNFHTPASVNINHIAGIIPAASINLQKNTDSDKKVTLIAVGDVMLSRGVAHRIRINSDPSYPFLNIRDYLKTADIVFGNLESPITAGPIIHADETIFHANPGIETALKNAGFSVMSLANNHIPDFGDRGIKNTIAYLDTAGIKHSGAGIDERNAYDPAYIRVNDLTFAFLAYNDTDVIPLAYGADENHSGTALMNIPKMEMSVKRANKSADFVIVSMHAGNEYSHIPNISQKNFARASIDAGADIVIGHHPHVIQPFEKYKGKYIFYSLGNFIFDQAWEKNVREGMAIKAIFTKQGIENLTFAPVVIENYSQPRLATGTEAEAIARKLRN